MRLGRPTDFEKLAYYFKGFIDSQPGHDGKYEILPHEQGIKIVFDKSIPEHVPGRVITLALRDQHSMALDSLFSDPKNFDVPNRTFYIPANVAKMWAVVPESRRSFVEYQVNMEKMK